MSHSMVIKTKEDEILPWTSLQTVPVDFPPTSSLSIIESKFHSLVTSAVIYAACVAECCNSGQRLIHDGAGSQRPERNWECGGGLGSGKWYDNGAHSMQNRGHRQNLENQRSCRRGSRGKVKVSGEFSFCQSFFCSRLFFCPLSNKATVSVW